MAAFFSIGLAAAGPVIVSPTVTHAAGAFHYSFAIANSGVDDLLLVDIPVPAVAQSIFNLTAPSGFHAAFDSGLGLVSFLEDTSSFGTTPTGGFSFDSLTGPGDVSFQATLLGSANGNVFADSGPTTAPVPEPAYFWAVASGVLLVMSRRRIKL